MSKQQVILIILDGWGIGRSISSNPIHAAHPPFINYLKSNYQSGALQASGIAVGLPWGEEGNSEVGHLTIGAGKVIYQHFPRITLAIQNGSFFKNKVLRQAISHAVKNRSTVNLAGLVSQGNVHSSLKHLAALIKLIQTTAPRLPIKLHIFSDGRDSPPHSLLQLLPQINRRVKVASLAGRYFAMDRNRHWDRTREAFKAMTGKGAKTDDFVEYIKQQYNRGLGDEYLPPVAINPSSNALADNDALIFFNFREDRMRQLAALFFQSTLKNIFYASFTKYSDRLPIPAAFPTEKVSNPLGKALSDRGKLQLRVAETEKYAHVTYFFNGLNNQPFKNEYRILIPSRNVIHHDHYPEMRAKEIASRIIQATEERQMDFILANFANPDMIAHTANFSAALAAVKVIDRQIKMITEAALAAKTTLIITSDHGNLEQIIDPITGAPETKHNFNPVPFYLINQKFSSPKSAAAVQRAELKPVGVLSDVAPTVLELMGIPKPQEMTGQSLIGRLY